MLDLGRAEVPMGSNSLEHERERKAVRLLATLRPGDTLGQGPADGVAVVVHHADGAVAVELDDAESDQLAEVVAGCFVVVDDPGSHQPDGVAPGGYIARDGGKALVFQRLVERFDFAVRPGVARADGPSDEAEVRAGGDEDSRQEGAAASPVGDVARVTEAWAVRESMRQKAPSLTLRRREILSPRRAAGPCWP